MPPKAGAIGDIGHRDVRLGVGQSRERVAVAAAERHPRAALHQQARGCFADAGTGANQPYALAVPVGQFRVQAHEPFLNAITTSPSLKPNLRISDLFSITPSSIRYIQSSNCTS